MKICLLVVTETKKSSRTKQIRVRTHIYKIFSSSERERERSTGIVKFQSVQLAFIVIISYTMQPDLPGNADWEYVINKKKIIITGKIETFNWKNLDI